MKFESLRSYITGSAFALVAALVLASCGGGASAPNPNPGGPLSLQPALGTLYAGVEYTFHVQGGRGPYSLASSEPVLFAVPSTTGGVFRVIPNNTGVVDVGQTPEQLPTRQVTVTVRDTVGTPFVAEFDVAQNFMTGYGVDYVSNCVVGTGDAPAACAGGETAVRFSATVNGLLLGNRIYRLDILRGPFFWVFPSGQIAGGSITVQTDHAGVANAIFRVNPGVQTQIGVYRITDVATGAAVEQLFIIDGLDQAAELTALPDEITFTGALTTQCGTGSADFLVFDGTPPYTAVSSFSSITVTPSTSSSQPGRFTVTANDPNTCVSDGTIIVTDANLSRTTVTVNTEAGSNEPPPPPLRVTPSQLTVSCSESASAVAVGGSDTISATSPTPDITVTVVDRTIQVTRTGAQPETDPTPTFAIITVTDGADTANLRVNYPTGCS